MSHIKKVAVKQDEVTTIDCNIGTAIVYTAKAPDKTSDNEDSCAIIQINQQSCVLIVADGMGGAALGDTASEIVIDGLFNLLKKSDESISNNREAILDGIEVANRKIIELGVGAGSTVALVDITNNVVRPYHVGDSKIMIIGGKGKVKLETISHSPTDYAVESGYLEPTDALEHEARHFLTNALGSRQMRIEIGSQFKLAKKDTILIASDGLYDNIHIHEIIDIVHKGKLHEVMEKLIQLSAARMMGQADNVPSKIDDLTIILYRCN